MILENPRKKLEPIFLTLLRAIVGSVMAAHGWQKLTDLERFTNVLASLNIPFPEISAYLAIACEFAGGLGLMVGLLTPLAAFGVFCSMSVAVFHVHWGQGLFAKNNGFEYPLTLWLISLYFTIRGAGPISLDCLLSRKKKG